MEKYREGYNDGRRGARVLVSPSMPLGNDYRAGYAAAQQARIKAVMDAEGLYVAEKARQYMRIEHGRSRVRDGSIRSRGAGV